MANLLPIGLHDQMRVLAKAARDVGITVPLFSNDGFEEGGWVPRPELDGSKKKAWEKSKFGLDLYGFDKYSLLLQAPPSHGLSTVASLLAPGKSGTQRTWKIQWTN
ncbi:hypothetical protein RMATCC62417_17647 [Rhizopus microsporus]|nr:hypothetical protein RMATCC62417_17647 [Rhizopus microsporus]